MSFFDHTIKNQNKEFIECLTGKETIGIDKEGRLYEVMTTALKFKTFFFINVPKEVEQVVVEYASDLFFQGKEFHELQTGSKSYLNVKKRLSDLHLVNQDIK